MPYIPPALIVAMVATVTWAIVAVVLGLPLIRAWVTRMERKSAQQHLPADAAARLARIESAVDTIAVEVERISEGQRFLTKLQSEKRITPEQQSFDRDR
jgi:hypothetical protein